MISKRYSHLKTYMFEIFKKKKEKGKKKKNPPNRYFTHSILGGYTSLIIDRNNR